MKKLFLTLALLLPLMVSAMKIEKDEVDEFTGKRTLITSWQGCAKNDIHVRFRFQNNKEFLDFKFVNNAAIVIGKEEKLMFKSTSDEIATFYSVATYHGGLGEGAVGLNKSGMWGISASYTGDLEYFADNVTRLIRIYETEGYYDKQVSENDGKQICKLYNMFANAMRGEAGSAKYANYNLKFLKKRVNGTTFDTVKEERKLDLSSEELQNIIEEWKAQSNDNYIYDVQVKKEK